MKKARGERTGNIPLGCSVAPDGATLIAEPGEQAVILRVQALRASGMPIRTITAVLNAEGHPARGKKWYASNRPAVDPCRSRSRCASLPAACEFAGLSTKPAAP